MYGREVAEVYDALHRVGKDYRGEAAALTRLVRARRPDARTLLDVACGTGEHLVWLRPEFAVAGVDASADMIAIARTKLPGAPLSIGDMRDLALGRTFDVVCCLFSSIGFMPDPVALAAAIARLAAHVRPGGVLAVEPWVFPEDWHEGVEHNDVARTADRHILRHSRSTARGRRCVVDWQIVVRDAQGTRRFRETQELTLFTRAEYAAAFAAAGMTAEYVTDYPSNRGLFLSYEVDQGAAGTKRE